MSTKPAVVYHAQIRFLSDGTATLTVTEPRVAGPGRPSYIVGPDQLVRAEWRQDILGRTLYELEWRLRDTFVRRARLQAKAEATAAARNAARTSQKQTAARVISGSLREPEDG